MNLNPFKSFVIHSQTSRNPLVKRAADELAQQMNQSQETEDTSQPYLQKQEAGSPINEAPKDQIDQTMAQVMPDLEKNVTDDKSQFGKAASAYAADVEVGSLPKATQEDIKKFAPAAKAKTKLVQYGMVTSELLPKVDQHNYKSAKAHIQEDIKKNGKRAAGDKFQDKVDDKYILLLNDQIIDGHHMLALADALGISCSLKVLDLTPIRFQLEKRSSLLYALFNNSRSSAA